MRVEAGRGIDGAYVIASLCETFDGGTCACAAPSSNEPPRKWPSPHPTQAAGTPVETKQSAASFSELSVSRGAPGAWNLSEVASRGCDYGATCGPRGST